MTLPPTPSDDSAGLEQLLEAYHRDQAQADVDEPHRQLVLFRLQGQRFALPGSAVSEILSGEQPVYFVPGQPDSVEGVIHLRGRIESVIRLNALLGLTASDQGGMILLVRGAGMKSGVRIDQLDDVTDVGENAFKAPPENLPERLKPFVDTLVYDDAAETTTVLDAEALFHAYQAGQG